MMIRDMKIDDTIEMIGGEIAVTTTRTKSRGNRVTAMD
jgi:hypothetical protein